MKPGFKRLLILFVFLGMPAVLLSQELFDDFDGPALNRSVWRIANRKWGEVPSKPGNGGVVPQNVWLENGNLVIRANGNLYKGSISGHGQNIRVGGAVFSRRRFASGRYEIRAKICPRPGALSAFWTYYHRSDHINHEIDFEFPGRNQEPYHPENSDLSWGLLSNWRGTQAGQHRTADLYLGNQADGNYHLYRFDWYSGKRNEIARLEWYVDDRLVHTSFEQVPSRRANFWLGVWFPWWIGNADFETDYMYVDWVKISSFR